MNLNVAQRRERKRSQKRARTTEFGRDLAALLRDFDAPIDVAGETARRKSEERRKNREFAAMHRADFGV